MLFAWVETQQYSIIQKDQDILASALLLRTAAMISLDLAFGQIYDEQSPPFTVFQMVETASA